MKPHPLKAEREKRGWSQAKIAESLGISTRTVIRWERGLALPHPHYRKQLSDLFGKTDEELGLVVGNVLLNTLQDAPQPVAPDLPESTSLLVDPAIPENLGDAKSLLGRD